MSAHLPSKIVILPLLLVSFLDIYPVDSWSLDKPPAPAPVATKVNTNLPSEEALFKEGKFEQVIASFATKSDKIDSNRYRLLGKSYSALNNYIMAIKNFDLAVLLNPKDSEARALRGMELLKIGKEREARVEFKEALEIDPKNETAYLGIEKYYLKKNNRFELRSLYAEMLEKLGPNADYYLRLCEVNIQSGIYEAAKTSCEKGIALAKQKEPRLYILLARALKESNHPTEAEDLYKKTTADFPKCDECQMAYAAFLDSRANTIESEKYYKAATLSKPRLAAAWIGLANARFENLKYQESLDAFREACKVNPKTVAYIRTKQAKAMEQKQDVWISKYGNLGDECSSLFIEPPSSK